jgi:chromosomal replication initiator protein
MHLRRLEDFVVGESNRLAFAAACRVVDIDDGHGLSVLFVHGECGVGKTHLLQGICRRSIERTGRPGSVRYVTGEQFTNEFIAAVRTNTLDAFRARMRKLDLLAIDDVHFLSNKVRTQSEFLYTLDAIGLGGAKIVMASDDHPRHIKRFNQALVSRFISGMVVKVDRPDRCTRLELIRRLASVRSLSLNDAAVDTIAGQCVGSVRELEGAITRLAAVTTLLHEPHVNGTNGHAPAAGGNEAIGALLAQQVIGNHVTGGVGTHIKLHGLIDVVCERLNVARTDLTGSGRHRRVVLARAVVAYLSRELTTHSYPEIAQALGREYHSTVHTADQRLRKQLHDNEPLDPRTAGPQSNLRELVDQLRYEVVKSASRPG